MTTLRPVLEPSKIAFTARQRNAFREIAKAPARTAGDESRRRPPAACAPLQVKEHEAAPAQAAKETAEAGLDPGAAAQPHADVLDRLPVAVLVNRGEEALYANRTLLDLLDHADLADFKAGGTSAG